MTPRGHCSVVKMSFIRELTNDLRTAAHDLRQNGLNLDSLREEIGNEKREPLPTMPTLKKKSVAGSAPEEPSATPQAAADKVSNGEHNGSTTVEPHVQPASARLGQEPSSAVLAKDTAQSQAEEATKSRTSVVGELLTQSASRRFAQGLSSAGTNKDKELERLQQRYERCKQGLYRFEASAARGYADYAKACEQLRETTERVTSERAELLRLRELAKRDADLAQRALQERDASAAELEAVALRQVDALQAEVATLRREKRRAESLQRELDTLRSERRAQAQADSSASCRASELRAAKVQLSAARSAASAAARAARAAVDEATERASASETELGSARLEIAELKAALTRAQREGAELRQRATGMEGDLSRDSKRRDDADELRRLLRQAVNEKQDAEDALQRAKRDLDKLAELKAAQHRKAESDLKGLKGELAAARKALRETRQAIVDGRESASDTFELELPARDDDDVHSTTSSTISAALGSSHIIGASGAAEYLRTVVTTALPAAHRADDTKTRARLVPVLRSLLSLPHETVVSSLEALAKTHGGGDFALALLAASSNAADRSKKQSIVTTAEAAREQDAVARRIELGHELDDVKARLERAEQALDAKQSELEACRHDANERIANAHQRTHDVEAALDARTRDAIAAVEEQQDRCAKLEAAADSASRAAHDALRRQMDFENALKRVIDDRHRGLNAEQLEYLRGTLLCFLKGFGQAPLRKQLLPVIVKVLKLDPQDPRIEEFHRFGNDHL